MKTLLIILAIIGLLKLVSLFILCIVEIHYKINSTIKKTFLQIKKEYGIFYTSSLYIIPTITVNISHYFEFSIKWLCVDYYCSYWLTFEEDES